MKLYDLIFSLSEPQRRSRRIGMALPNEEIAGVKIPQKHLKTSAFFVKLPKNPRNPRRSI
ncbi:MAG: hypothetical protein NTW93_10370 [Phycisphaerae bacterium]|nr:hypothetical protein [Phycisphaerae bacterium]